MKKLIALIIVFIITSCQNSTSMGNSFYQMSKNYGKYMKEEFGLYLMEQPIFISQAGKKLRIDFYHYDEVEVRQARLLIHRCAKEALLRINRTKDLSSLLHRFPLNENDLEISISFIDRDTHKIQTRDHVAHVSLFNGRIHYSKFDKDSENFEPIIQEDIIVANKISCN